MPATSMLPFATGGARISYYLGMETKRGLPTNPLSEPPDEETHALAADLTAAPANKEDAPAPPAREQPLILVVDDVVDNLVVISLGLQHHGYRVVTAGNGEEAIRVATLSQPDLILMDIGMPQMDGLDATRKIRASEALRNIPVVAITAFSTDGFRRAAYDVGFNGYLVKPVDFARLHELIHNLLAPK